MLDQILNLIDLYFYKLKNQIKELLSYSYISNDYSILISKLQNHNEKIKDHFIEKTKLIREQLRSRKEDELSFEKDDYNEIAFYFEYINSFNFFISNIRNSRNINIHQGNFILTKEITKYISKDSNFLILQYPRGVSINYGYIDISKYLNKFNKFSKEKEVKDFLLFFIPYFNQEDIFDNSALGHEIGHFIEEKYGISTQIIDFLISKQILHKNEVENIVKSRNSHILEQEWEDQIIYDTFITPFYNNWVKKTKLWIKEIVCDILGLKIFGLPSFFAFIDIMFLTNPEDPGDDEHPPDWLRIKYLIREIRKTIYNDLEKLNIEEENKSKLKGQEKIIDNLGKRIQKRIDFIGEEFSKNNQITTNGLDLIVINIIDSEEVQEKIDEILDKLVKDRSIKEFNYTDEKTKEIILLIKLLKEYITPNEIVDTHKKESRYADIITILNSGWFFYLYKLKIHYGLFNVKEEEYEEKSYIQQKLNNLILKAIELSNIHKEAKEKLNE